MTFKTMIEAARENGTASEETMWKSIEEVDSFLEGIKAQNPEKYWCFIRKMHTKLSGAHYDEQFAEYDVKEMHCTDKNGIEQTGAYWTKDEIIEATQDKTFPDGTTDWDKYVAYNAMHCDFCKIMTGAEILEAAYQFYFADEDAPEGKIWRYMYAMKCPI